MILLSSLLLIILVLWIVGMALKQPANVRLCSLISIPLYVLIGIMAIILFLLAIALGDGTIPS